jgi:hypothetical protein
LKGLVPSLLTNTANEGACDRELVGYGKAPSSARPRRGSSSDSCNRGHRGPVRKLRGPHQAHRPQRWLRVLKCARLVPPKTVHAGATIPSSKRNGLECHWSAHRIQVGQPEDTVTLQPAIHRGSPRCGSGSSRLKSNSDLGRTLGRKVENSAPPLCYTLPHRVQTSAALDPMTPATTIGVSDSDQEGTCGHLAEVEQGLSETKVGHDDGCLLAPGRGGPPSGQVRHLSLTAEAQCSLTSLGQQKRVMRAGLASAPSHGPCLRQGPMLCPSMPAQHLPHSQHEGQRDRNRGHQRQFRQRPEPASSNSVQGCRVRIYEPEARRAGAFISHPGASWRKDGPTGSFQPAAMKAAISQSWSVTRGMCS